MTPQRTPPCSYPARKPPPGGWRGANVAPAGVASAFAAATDSAADDATPAPTGTSDVTAMRTPFILGSASSVQSSRSTPATYVTHPFGSSSCHRTLMTLSYRVEIASRTPGALTGPGPTATVVRSAIAIGSTGPPL